MYVNRVHFYDANSIPSKFIPYKNVCLIKVPRKLQCDTSQRIIYNFKLWTEKYISPKESIDKFMYIYVSISSRDKYLKHATSIMRNLLKCEKACDRACRYILCYRTAILYRAHSPAALTAMSAHRRAQDFEFRFSVLPWKSE